ncbi:hypothetical protein AYI70_g7572 [Smittium culicis]|uniref:Uncharacterized protein n=1 Tax=Smittium culicis TaxID=133412 RepID=A0A1R1XK34_9FUNG|nr:hypothetical protein AYI70_g7572 [Smittium culicis]
MNILSILPFVGFGNPAVPIYQFSDPDLSDCPVCSTTVDKCKLMKLQKIYRKLVGKPDPICKMFGLDMKEYNRQRSIHSHLTEMTV